LLLPHFLSQFDLQLSRQVHFINRIAVKVFRKNKVRPVVELKKKKKKLMKKNATEERADAERKRKREK
jgi:hypothetical protein